MPDRPKMDRSFFEVLVLVVILVIVFAGSLDAAKHDANEVQVNCRQVYTTEMERVTVCE